MAFWRRGTGQALRYAALTDVGRQRDHNEDAVGVVLPPPEAGWGFDLALIVCDGVGGHSRGEVASRQTVETVTGSLSRPDGAPLGERLRAAASEANAAVRAYAAREVEGALMGTTLVVAAVSGRVVTVGHAGDSRAYRIGRGGIAVLTADHSMVAEQVRVGLILATEARTHPLRSRITRAVGMADTLALDVQDIAFDRGDVVLVCTDGLHGLVEDREILAAVGNDLEASARSLIALANERGGTDNVTVALYRVE